MIPHIQQIIGDPARGDGHDVNGRPGDCWKTCIAAVLNIANLDEVPHFVEAEDWWTATQLFIRAHLGDNFSLRWWTAVDAIPGSPAFLIAAGDSPRGDFQHAVVAGSSGAMVHDPHPSGLGLKGEPSEYFAIVNDSTGVAQ